MADKAAEVSAAAKQAFSQYRQRQNPRAAEEGTFIAGFMAGYLLGFKEGLDDDPFGRVVSRMLANHAKAIVVSHEARTYTLSLTPS